MARQAGTFGLELVDELPPIHRVRGGRRRPTAVAIGLRWADPPPRYVAPDSARPHGSHAKYAIEKCRCDPCTAASTAYETARRRAIARPDCAWVPYVPAGRARAHVRDLAAAGVGRKTVAALSGVAHGTLSKLMFGDPKRGMAPSKRIRPETERRILAVTVDHAAGAQRIDSSRTWKLLDELIARGWSRGELARRLGRQGPGLQIKRTMVYASTARQVERLYAELADQEPPRYGRWNPRPR